MFKVFAQAKKKRSDEGLELRGRNPFSSVPSVFHFLLSLLFLSGSNFQFSTFNSQLKKRRDAASLFLSGSNFF